VLPAKNADTQSVEHAFESQQPTLPGGAATARGRAGSPRAGPSPC
jgi:hypothetical protein